MLQRFVGQSQFVLISHNKRTIAMADAIYGVTMEDHGVSKLVSVKFAKKAATQPGTSSVPRIDTAPIVVGVSTIAIPRAMTASGSNASRLLVLEDSHAPGHEPIHNDLLNEHDSRREPIALRNTIESYKPENEDPADSEISTAIVEDETQE